ncbi:phosphonate C-P lyase system protein PhnG [Magnetospirillum sp. UT-4]|uniref:phosphonate C-P lyase system protein PhnG n=1 Tax=Magnetospirillum sp. UT-4 TaxID=2681467 RepID=UPI0013850A13|nr:phosphonate C-P lyase system protein PhnG [Magnetospirillum sp. UT-4]CAA7616885.1 carbon-phosphorus lyase complex subunit [Magnetospirillum sp. UT-4]
MPPAETEFRRRWMGVLAKAAPAEIAAAWHRLASPPAYALLRRPEIGLVMVRGRAGGDGGAFNLGEMTVTRCSVRLPSGIVGHAWVAGRAPAHAERAAVIDALLQQGDATLGPEIDRLEALQAERRTLAARKAAATRVDFFTMVRGED